MFFYRALLLALTFIPVHLVGQPLTRNLAALPMQFEMNQGQSDAQVRFLARGPGYGLFLTPEEAVLSLREFRPGNSQAQPPETLRLRLAGGRAPASIDGIDALPGKSNYFIGNHQDQWRTNVPSYARVRYTQVYPGVDLEYYGNQTQLEYDFIVAPGTDPRAVRMKFDGVRRLSLDREGNLLLHTRGETLVLHRPVTYQKRDGVRTAVASRYVLHGHREVGFEIGAYDASRRLIIDPVLVYSTFLSSSQFDVADAIAVDASGNAYITGMTVSPDFPTVTPVQGTYKGGNDAYVAKLNAVGSALVFSTFLGGSGADIGFAIAIDPSGNVYVTGQTNSTDFPLANALQSTCTNCPSAGHAFVAKLNPAGNALVYSTYLGGSTGEIGHSIAADSSGNAYVAGDTFSLDFPTTTGAFQTTCGGGLNRPCTDGFVAKLKADGSALVYATYLGATLDDSITAIALDSSGNAYVTGVTNSNNFPTTPGSFISHCDLATLCNAAFNNAFVTKLNASGSALVYSSYLGGSFADDGASAIAVDSTGHAYVTGFTSAFDFPVTPGVVQPLCARTSEGVCNGNAFITKFKPDGSGLDYSTYLSGSFGSSGGGIAVNSAGEAYIVGVAASEDFPMMNPLQPCTSSGSTVLVKLNSTASSLIYSTCLGGFIGVNTFSGIAIDSTGNAYLAGATMTKFPVTSGAFHTTGPGALVVKINPGNAPGPAFSDQNITFSSVAVGVTSTPFSVTFYNMGTAPLNITSMVAAGDFAQTNNCGGSIAAASSCVLNITFTPTATGPRSGTITITDNSGSPQTLSLSGTGINPMVVLTPPSLTFGNQPIGTNSSQTVTLTNNGIGPLSPVNVLGGSGDFFGTSNCLDAVQAGGSCTITIRFNPSAGGTRTGNITVSDNASDSPQSIPVSGSSTGPGFILSATSLVFPDQNPGTTSPPQNVTLTNNGTATLTISSITVSSAFQQTNDCGTGLIVGASCTMHITFAPLNSGTFDGLLTISDNLPGSPQSIPLHGTSPVVNANVGLRFLPTVPCRVADTRNPNGPFGGPFLAAQTSRAFTIPDSACGIPATAAAYSVNLTVVPKGPLGFLTMYPCGQAVPVASTLNSTDGRVKAEAAIVPAGTGGAICAFVSNDTELIIDINGYFVPATDVNALAFFPMLTPCRLVDTRQSAGPLGGPLLVAGETRTFPLRLSSCGGQATLQAYSLNFTVVPKGPLGFLTIWPAGQSQPLVSTLNAPTGTVTANAAIVPRGTNGDLSVFVTNNTDLVIDMNGFFAPPQTGGLSLFPLAPCRVLDTRNPPGSPPISGQLDVNVLGSNCNVPPESEAYVFNATVVPPAQLGFLTLWPQAGVQPLASTLNDLDGTVTSNMAIVDTFTGSISAFVSNPTHLLLDISGYFAP